MLHFSKNYIYFMVVEVLEPNFLKLKQRLLSGEVKTIDDMMAAHTEYLDECLKGCLLTDQILYRVLTKIN
jgi:gamma-tubulin complex component 2